MITTYRQHKLSHHSFNITPGLEKFVRLAQLRSAFVRRQQLPGDAYVGAADHGLETGVLMISSTIGEITGLTWIHYHESNVN